MRWTKSRQSFWRKMCDSKKLENYFFYRPILSFCSHVRNISQTTFSEQSSRMAESVNGTTQWVVLKKIDHYFIGELYRFAGFGTSRPLSLRCQEPNATVDFSPFLQIVIKIQWYLGDWNAATDFREKPSSFWAKNLKTPRFRLCRIRNFLCEYNFQRYYHWKTIADEKMLIETMIEDMENFFGKTSLYLKTSHSIMNVLT